MFRAIFKVCAEFRTPDGKVNVRPEDRLVLKDWPDAIKKDPLFPLLINDGSVELVQTKADAKRLENDPDANMTAEGKTRKRKKKAEETEATTEAGGFIDQI